MLRLHGRLLGLLRPGRFGRMDRRRGRHGLVLRLRGSSRLHRLGRLGLTLTARLRRLGRGLARVLVGRTLVRRTLVNRALVGRPPRLCAGRGRFDRTSSVGLANRRQVSLRRRPRLAGLAGRGLRTGRRRSGHRAIVDRLGVFRFRRARLAGARRRRLTLAGQCRRRAAGARSERRQAGMGAVGGRVRLVGSSRCGLRTGRFRLVGGVPFRTRDLLHVGQARLRGRHICLTLTLGLPLCACVGFVRAVGLVRTIALYIARLIARRLHGTERLVRRGGAETGATGAVASFSGAIFSAVRATDRECAKSSAGTTVAKRRFMRAASRLSATTSRRCARSQRSFITWSCTRALRFRRR